MLNNLILIIDFLRLHQWVKNFFMVSPLIFSGHFHDFHLWLKCTVALTGFCLISSGMYIINDLSDLVEDQLHPKKSQRPVAAGQVSIIDANTIAAVMLVLGGALCYTQGEDVLLLALAYILLHLLYNMRTKYIVVLDVLTVALGFQFRIWAGAVAVNVLPSAWLQICMFVLALFLGFTKRRCEIMHLRDGAAFHRSVLSKYTVYLLDQMIMICAALSILLYGLYTVSPEVIDRIHNYAMLYSTSFVVFGIFRYLYLIHIKKLGDDPSEILLSDIPLMVNILLWLAFVMVTLKLSHV